MRRAWAIFAVLAIALTAFCPYPADTPTMTHWRASVNAMLAGTSNARLLIIGDSVTAGAWAQPTNVNSVASAYPTVLASLLTTASLSATSQSRMGDGNWDASGIALGTADARVVVGGYPSNNAVTTFGGHMMQGNAATSTAAWTFTPTTSVDSFDFYWLSASGDGTMTIDIDGGTGTVLNANVTAALHKTTISTTAGTHTFRVRPTTGSTRIMGVIGYTAGTKQIQTINGGWNGARVASWTTTTGAGHYYDPLDVLNFLAPDLTIICLTINDAHDNGSTTTYKSNLQAIIDKAKLTGDVLMLSGPMSAAYYTAQPIQDAFFTAFRDTAAANFIPIVFSFGGGYAEILSNSEGFTDGIHLNATGQSALATFPLQQVSLH